MANKSLLPRRKVARYETRHLSKRTGISYPYYQVLSCGHARAWHRTIEPKTAYCEACYIQIIDQKGKKP